MTNPPEGAAVYFDTGEPGHVGLCVSAPSWWERLPIIRRFRDQRPVVIEGNSVEGIQWVHPPIATDGSHPDASWFDWGEPKP